MISIRNIVMVVVFCLVLRTEFVSTTFRARRATGMSFLKVGTVLGRLSMVTSVVKVVTRVRSAVDDLLWFDDGE